MNTSASSTASRHWKPNVTVAAIIEQDGKFLLVEETTDRGNRFNQPAGHLEEGETIIDAAIRETLEETAYDFTPQALVGIYHWQHPLNGVTYLRFAFSGILGAHHAERALDTGIIRTVWKTETEIATEGELMRSPQVLLCVQDYLAGKRYPLDILKHLGQAL
ncbi:NUDIX domain-containing protein [Methylophilus rhizosphaerae]|uniref:Phosphatase NudJ n=1 Tax=Methylophilus rhizosphaerae TaxID=492660 RepID=A0A1G9D1G4_9PROT|nr:NUDIX hydrolase [Methylophilus rhizosphaerae]SDK57747.1 NUDIX domain-containing protein [Methylophilus rhizosphaerae]